MSRPFYDVFIFHAYEDQNEFAGQLALALKKKGLNVWYSGFELKLGASITTSVQAALLKSRCGVMLISPVYLTKKWAIKELGELFGKEIQEQHVLLILHGISIKEFRNKSPFFAGRHVVSTRRGIEYVVNRILQLITSETESVDAKKGKAKRVARRKASPEAKKTHDTGVIVLGGVVAKVKSGGATIKKRRTP